MQNLFDEYTYIQKICVEMLDFFPIHWCECFHMEY